MTEADEAGLLWTHADSSADWFEESEQAPIAVEESLMAGLGLSAGAGPRLLRPRSPSREQEGQRSIEDVLDGERARSRRVGILVHYLFEQIGWLCPEDSEREVLERRLAPLEPVADRRSAALDLYATALASEPIRSLLEEPSDGAEHQVFNEQPYMLPDASGTGLVAGVVDRLVLRLQDGRPVAAEVIDWKTDALLPEEDPERHAAKHRAQLEDYRQAVAARYELELGAVQGHIALLSVGLVF